MQEALREVAFVAFPTPADRKVNMMPIVMGDDDTVPDDLKGYLPLIRQCDLDEGSTVYLTVHESFVEEGESQRRGGAHIEAPTGMSWGGTWGGMDKGLYMASTDGRTLLWDYVSEDGDSHGALEPEGPSFMALPNMMYWLTDHTPHEAVVADKSGYRQFFRLVSEDVSVWFTQHNTPNPLGVMPTCPMVDDNKFEVMG